MSLPHKTQESDAKEHQRKTILDLSLSVPQVPPSRSHQESKRDIHHDSDPISNWISIRYSEITGEQDSKLMEVIVSLDLFAKTFIL
jgi:hypothetical protein